MEPAGVPWPDPRRGHVYGVGSAVQPPSTRRQQQQQQPAPAPVRQDGAAVATGGGLKRTMGEMERWQQAVYLRAVRQRVAAPPQPQRALDIGAVLAGSASRGAGGFSRPPAGYPGVSAQPSSALSSLTTATRVATPAVQHMVQRQMMAPPSAQAARAPATSRPATPREVLLLQELEKQLLGDEEEAEAAGSACGSAVTTSVSEWGETMREINSLTSGPSPSLPLPSAINHAVPVSRSPTNSSSSTASSTASSSPPTSAASSRQLLSEAAAAVADGSNTAAAAHLAVLRTVANPRGDAEQRLVAMMAAALSARLAPPSPQHLVDLCSGEQRAKFQLLHDVSPCFGLALHAANLAILDAVADHRAIHLVDFDVSVAQHVALIHALANRRAAGTSLKVTAVVDPTSPLKAALAQALPATGERLTEVARRAGLRFRFEAVSCRAGEIKASRLGCEPGEALAVNLAFALSRVPDESVSPANPRDELLRGVRALGPAVVTLVEQELNTNTAPLAARFADTCAHYGAVLESLDATPGCESAERGRAEAALAAKAANAVAREGAERVERCEVFGKWRARFGMAGLRPVAIGQGVAERVKARLGHARPGFVVKFDGGRIEVGWNGRAVTVASAWR
ncbi:hypothetical protein ACP4OV_006136 [Aristida adscensionis]